MSDPIERAPAVVRAERFELVDGTGNVLAVLGPLDTPDPTTPVHGLALFNADGRPRIWLGLDNNGPALVIDLLGNNAISLGANVPVPDALHVGAYLRVTDLDGTPVYGWQVEEDGTVLARLGVRAGERTADRRSRAHPPP